MRSDPGWPRTTLRLAHLSAGKRFPYSLYTGPGRLSVSLYTGPGKCSGAVPKVRGMRLLVTGAAGFIGSNFVHYWVERHPDDEVVALDLLTYAGNKANLRGVEEQIDFVEGDIGDLELGRRLLEEYDIEVVVNFAAESHNSLAVVDPRRFFHTNVIGTQTLLEAARDVGGLQRFHHVSTCEVYGDLPLDSDEMFTEESPYRPRTPYNASKAGADHAVRAYHETFGIPISITNCSNNYGPYQFPEKVIPLFVTNALDDRELPMYASTQNKREWLHVRDHCRAIELVLESDRIGETYNVGSGLEASIEDIADLVVRLTGKSESLKTIVPDRPGHDRRYLLDSSKLRQELGWEPEISWEEGLRETVEWYAANREWWEPLKERAPVEETAWR
jgi:dTDP-glucose 4,6-dehydratase